MNKIINITLHVLAYLILPIIATGIIQFFLMIILGISMTYEHKVEVLITLYILEFMAISIRLLICKII